MRLVVLAVLIIFALVVASSWVTRANYADTETSADNTFQAGDVDLKISNTSYYNGKANADTSWDIRDLTDELFFNFLDLKPNDYGEDTIGLRVMTNPSWLCADIEITANDDNTCNEPELAVDTTCSEPNDNLFDGDLAEVLQFIFWVDDGDNVMEEGEKELVRGPASAVLGGASYALSDVTGNVFDPEGGPLEPEKDYFIGKAWCFGELEVSPAVDDADTGPDIRTDWLSCDGEAVGNASQTDNLTGNIQFRATQSRGNPNFSCDDCIQVEENWLTQIVSVNQGKRLDNTDVLIARSNPSSMMGAPQGTNADNTFFSLGFGGEAVVKFASPVMDLSGMDLSFHEATNLPYPEEKMNVFGSQDGITFEPIGSVTNTGGGVKYLDINGTLPWLMYLRLVDATNPGSMEPTADGYDIDAIDATNYNTCIQINKS